MNKKTLYWAIVLLACIYLVSGWESCEPPTCPEGTIDLNYTCYWFDLRKKLYLFILHSKLDIGGFNSDGWVAR